MSEPVLQLDVVCKAYRAKSGRSFVRAVDGVSLAIQSGRTLGLIGESGSGKSTLAKLALRLAMPTSGRVLFDGLDVAQAKGASLQKYRMGVQAVFQDPYSSLSPRMRVQEIIAEPLLANVRLTQAELKTRVAELLISVGLSVADGERYPHEFSGGQRQRIAIARGLALRPRVLILDEPVSALDASVRGQILNLLSAMQARYAMAYLFISHDLDVVAHLCDAIAVMYCGRIVELAPRAVLSRAPRHPYTQALFAATAARQPGAEASRELVADSLPQSFAGCPFAPRCPWAQPLCSQSRPALRAVGEAQVACHYSDVN